TGSSQRANATFVILARNSDLEGTVNSVRELEDRFNRRYQYPYVFLNDKPFDEKFKRRISILTDAKVEFGVVPQSDWAQPDWIDEDVAKAWRDWMAKGEIPYAGAPLSAPCRGSAEYRNMCRFNSGFFFRHPLMEKYRWYWRVEPDVRFHCDIDYDPFLFMEQNRKVYGNLILGFTISMLEYEATVMTLWRTVKEFIKTYPHFLAPNNSLDFISEDGGETYNLCHFWSNFEIADLDFWRGPAYQAFFDFLDYKGGFYYERWGDAPVHSIAAALFANRDQLHFFDKIGYGNCPCTKMFLEHPPFYHCPQKSNNWAKGRCTCDPDNNFDNTSGSCLGRWEKFINGTLA
ncbi:alpha-1,2-mannosyltransferase, partial [Coprinopsis sp. MPI-PUGE-AT-0042]